MNKPVPQEENRFVEFKEVRGKNPVNAIKNTADEYVVSFLNADGGTIIWGIRDSDRVVVGVPLDFQQRDRLRRDVVGKLNEIQPKIDPSQYSLAIYPVVDENGVVEDLHIVEIFVPQREEKTPFFTGGNECFIRTEGSKKKLAGPAFVDWLRIKSISETGI